MINFNQAISIIRRNGGFKPNRRDTSYYRTYTIEGNRPLQARVSNHGTWLWTWYDKDYDPSYAINFCVVFSENGEYDSDVSVDMNIKDERGNITGQKKPFEVIQYVYNCRLLDINDATMINQQVQSIWQNKGFKDPLANTPKKAKVMRLKPNEPIEQIVENKQYNTNRNMNRQIIRLTESDLHRIVKESVKRILRESNIPRYEQPVFIGCSSPNDADVSVEIGFNDYASSLFYVGECGTDGYAALEAVVEYLIQNGIIDHYTADEELVSEYPDGYVEVNGYYFDSSNIVMHQLVGNHGERRH